MTKELQENSILPEYLIGSVGKNELISSLLFFPNK